MKNSVLYVEKKKGGRRKEEEGRRKEEEGREVGRKEGRIKVGRAKEENKGKGKGKEEEEGK